MHRLDRRADARLPQLLAAAVAVLLMAALSILASPTPAHAADGGAEAQFVAALNAIRAQHGLAPLQVYGELTDMARGWTDQMVANGSISHNPNLANSVSANWTKLGENVGVGSDVTVLVNAFVASPAHFRNIIDPAYNYIGVGVSYAPDGRMFTTHDFMALGDQPAPADPAPAPEPAPAPAPRQAPAPAASAPTPSADAAPADAPPPPPAPTTAPALPARVHTVLTALRAVGD